MKPRKRLLTDPISYRNLMIELHIGPEYEHEKFAIHKDRATRHSEFISKALDRKKGWKEAKEGFIRLPEESPQAIEMFGVFIDTGHIHLIPSDREQGDMTPELESQEDIWSCLEDAWLLGERLLSTQFKDAVVDNLVEQLRTTAEVPKKMYKAIYRGSVGTSGMRRLLVDLAVFTWLPNEVREQTPDPECVEYFKDLCFLSMRRHTNSVPSSAPFDRADTGCYYHDHGEDGVCYKTMFKA